jgi:hypothetical protein
VVGDVVLVHAGELDVAHGWGGGRRCGAGEYVRQRSAASGRGEMSGAGGGERRGLWVAPSGRGFCRWS